MLIPQPVCGGTGIDHLNGIDKLNKINVRGYVRLIHLSLTSLDPENSPLWSPIPTIPFSPRARRINKWSWWRLPEIVGQEIEFQCLIPSSLSLPLPCSRCYTTTVTSVFSQTTRAWTLETLLNTFVSWVRRSFLRLKVIVARLTTLPGSFTIWGQREGHQHKWKRCRKM